MFDFFSEWRAGRDVECDKRPSKQRQFNAGIVSIWKNTVRSIRTRRPYSPSSLFRRREHQKDASGSGTWNRIRWVFQWFLCSRSCIFPQRWISETWICVVLSFLGFAFLTITRNSISTCFHGNIALRRPHMPGGMRFQATISCLEFILSLGTWL